MVLHFNTFHGRVMVVRVGLRPKQHEALGAAFALVLCGLRCYAELRLLTVSLSESDSTTRPLDITLRLRRRRTTKGRLLRPKQQAVVLKKM